ncbi:MAG: hypothetical protein GYA36_23370 [Veillonellaceae bacterium]|nr:hypothetical protein [Veillonellaceae bacterium]
MAEMFETDVTDYSFFTAGADLSAKQYHIVKLGSGGQIELCTSSDVPVGILVNKPRQGEAAKVRVKGVSRVKVSSAGLAQGAAYGADDNGYAVAMSLDKDNYLGMCLIAGPTSAGALATVSVDGMIRHTLHV